MPFDLGKSDDSVEQPARKIRATGMTKHTLLGWTVLFEWSTSDSLRLFPVNKQLKYVDPKLTYCFFFRVVEIIKIARLIQPKWPLVYKKYCHLIWRQYLQTTFFT